MSQSRAYLTYRSVILLGAPGVGKGTYAKLIQGALGIPHVSSGDLLRAEVKAKTPIGQRVTSVMQAGQLVDDAV